MEEEILKMMSTFELEKKYKNAPPILKCCMFIAIQKIRRNYEKINK